MKEEEKETFLKMLTVNSFFLSQSYHQYMENNPGSLICTIYGVFKVETHHGPPYYILLTRNISQG